MKRILSVFILSLYLQQLSKSRLKFADSILNVLLSYSSTEKPYSSTEKFKKTRSNCIYQFRALLYIRLSMSEMLLRISLFYNYHYSLLTKARISSIALLKRNKFSFLKKLIIKIKCYLSEIERLVRVKDTLLLSVAYKMNILLPDIEKNVFFSCSGGTWVEKNACFIPYIFNMVFFPKKIANSSICVVIGSSFINATLTAFLSRISKQTKI